MHGTRFYRTARDYSISCSNLPKSEIVIPAPSVLSPGQGGVGSWLLIFVPLVASLGTVAYAFVYHFNPFLTLVIVGIALLTSVVGIFARLQQQYAQKKREKADRNAYLDYLARLRDELSKTAYLQRQAYARLSPPPSRLLDIVKFRNQEQTQLWERRVTDLDFLQVRLGVGATPFCRPVRLDVNSNPFIQYKPELLAEAEQLVASYTQLEDAPIQIDLKTLGTLALVGNSNVTRGLMRSILCQLVAFHSPEDIRIAAYFPSQAVQEWEWLKWLPHTRRLQQVKKQQTTESLCLLADNLAELQGLLSLQIAPELERRQQLNAQDTLPGAMLPHLIILLDGYTPDGEIARLPQIQKLFQDKRNNGTDLVQYGATVICLVNTLRQEPSAIRARITISERREMVLQEIAEGANRHENIAADTAEVMLCEQISRSLAPVMLAERGMQQDLSQDVRLLDLLEIPSADAVQISETWKPRTQQDILRVPIGRRADGTPQLLDLKEAAEKGMGPHGLVIGATGSGKSELLRTLVMGLAITHNPQMVNFVLVDFKGGASFADIAALPHVKGIITNLENDPTLIDRVYSSLLGEQQYRQKLLREAGNLDNIRQYQTKQQMNSTMAPMPYLLIIVDEFSKLIASKQEFLELFVGIGQIGRSLGMHLLFATQRLEEGRLKGLDTYLSYRICLRTFSASESMAVLEKPDAFHLPLTPGIGYFKVGTTIYCLFKSAIITSPYISEAEKNRPSTLIRGFTPTGQLVSYVSVPTRPVAATSEKIEDEQTEMDMVIRRLAKAQVLPGSSSMHSVWLPPLEKSITLEAILRQVKHGDLDGGSWPTTPPFGPLKIPIGLVDKPLEQVQEPLMLDFSGAGGHLALVGSPRSGKSIFLSTIIASLIVTHSPRDVQIYAIDLGGRTLDQFAEAPHVGTVCTNSQKNGEKIRRLIYQMRKIIEDRVNLFGDQHIDSIATYRTRRLEGGLSEQLFGDVFLIIDNFAQLRRDFDQLETEIIDIVSNGLNYGVHVILTANRWSELPPKLLQIIGTRLELHLYDPIESEFGKVVAAALPAGLPGRGLTRDKNFFQTALPWVGGGKLSDSAPLATAISTLAQRTRQAWRRVPAPPIRLLPTVVKWQNEPQRGTNQIAGVPIGIDEFRFEPVYIDLISAGPHFLIFGDSECGKTNVLRVWMRSLELLYTPDQVQFAVIDLRRTLASDFAHSTHLFSYAASLASVKDCVERIKQEIDQRQQFSSQLDLGQVGKSWSGPHYYLFVDDYDIVTGQMANPLVPLLEALLNARDLGMHVVLARNIGGVTMAMNMDQVLKRLKDMGSPGLIMSGNPQDGFILFSQKANAFPPGRGFFVQRKQPATQIQVVLSEAVSTGKTALS